MLPARNPATKASTGAANESVDSATRRTVRRTHRARNRRAHRWHAPGSDCLVMRAGPLEHCQRSRRRCAGAMTMWMRPMMKWSASRTWPTWMRTNRTIAAMQPCRHASMRRQPRRRASMRRQPRWRRIAREWICDCPDECGWMWRATTILAALQATESGFEFPGRGFEAGRTAVLAGRGFDESVGCYVGGAM